VETTTYWRVAPAKPVSLDQLRTLRGGGGQPTRERAAVQDQEEQQRQDEGQVRDDAGGPGQHPLEYADQAVQVELADRSVDLLLGDPELAEPPGELVDQAGELRLVAGKQRRQPRHREHQGGGQRHQAHVRDQHREDDGKPAGQAVPLQPCQQRMDRDDDHQRQEGRSDDAESAAQASDRHHSSGHAQQHQQPARQRQRPVSLS
jgi:hypothetical protein